MWWGAGFGAGYNLNKNIGISARYTFWFNRFRKNGNVTDYFLDSKTTIYKLGKLPYFMGPHKHKN